MFPYLSFDPLKKILDYYYTNFGWSCLCFLFYLCSKKKKKVTRDIFRKLCKLTDSVTTGSQNFLFWCLAKILLNFQNLKSRNWFILFILILFIGLCINIALFHLTQFNKPQDCKNYFLSLSWSFISPSSLFAENIKTL